MTFDEWMKGRTPPYGLSAKCLQVWCEQYAAVCVAAEREACAEPLRAITEKCEQYWNGHNICDAEIHAALGFIWRHADAIRARGEK